MNPHLLRTLCALGFTSALVPALSAQTSIVSGDWTTGSTWNGGTPPTSAVVTIAGGHTVTAGAGASYNAAAAGTALNINGILNVQTGAELHVGTIYRANTAHGVINITGGLFSAQAVHYNNSESSVTINVSGGTFRSYATDIAPWQRATVHLSGNGTLSYANGGTGNGISSWQGGTLVTNTVSANASRNNAFFNLFKGYAGNRWALSDLGSAQTFTTGDLGAGGNTLGQGIIQFNIYSPASNDQIVSTHTAATDRIIKFSSGVTFDVRGINLSGEAEDYLGESFQLLQFGHASHYEYAQASIGSTVWNIGGADYNVTFTNNLTTDGSITVSNLSLVPEPSAFALLAGLATLGFIGLRRRR